MEEIKEKTIAVWCYFIVDFHNTERKYSTTDPKPQWVGEGSVIMKMTETSEWTNALGICQ